MDDILFKCKIKVPRHGILKNSKQIRVNKKTGARFIASSDNSTLCEAWIMRSLHMERIKQKIDEPINCDLIALFMFHFPNSVYFTKKGIRSKTLPDLDNLYSLPQDCLQKAKIIENDSIICGHDFSRRVPIDGIDYFVEIILLKYGKI